MRVGGRSASLAASALAVVVAVVPGVREAGGRGAPSGSALWVAGRELVRRPIAGGETAVLASLPVDPTRVRRLEAAADGSAVLIDLGGPAAWLDLSAGAPGRLTWLPCRGPAHLGSGGGVVACLAGGGMARFRVRPPEPATLIEGFAPTPGVFADPTGDTIVIQTGKDLVRRGPGTPDVVVAGAPVADLSIAPDGTRAVGGFDATAAGAGATLESFRLDGKAARRKLIPGTPVAWSADSAWLLVDTTAAACAVRAVGGEYKCWDGFRGRALDATGTRALLTRDNPAGGVDLFAAAVGGAQTAAPVPLATAVAGPAAMAP